MYIFVSSLADTNLTFRVKAIVSWRYKVITKNTNCEIHDLVNYEPNHSFYRFLPLQKYLKCLFKRKTSDSDLKIGKIIKHFYPVHWLSRRMIGPKVVAMILIRVKYFWSWDVIMLYHTLLVIWNKKALLLLVAWSAIKPVFLLFYFYNSCPFKQSSTNCNRKGFWLRSL